MICGECGRDTEGVKPENTGKWFNVAGIGTDGCEMLHSSNDKKRASKLVDRICLRARLNSHRNISVYAWTSAKEVTFENFGTRQRNAIIKSAKRVG